MGSILAMLPWEAIILCIVTLLVEFIVGKTDWFESSSVIEVIERIVKKLFSKDTKI